MNGLTSTDLIALMPILIVSGTIVAVMLAISWRRHHAITLWVTLVGLNAALLSLIAVSTITPKTVTSLIVVDLFSVFYMALILMASLACCTFAHSWLANFHDNKEEFYLLILLATLGAQLLVMATHLAALFIGIELLSLPLFGLIGYAIQQRRSLEATIKYLILSAATSAFLLFGMALLYAESGNLSFYAFGTAINQVNTNHPYLMAGMALLLVGFGFKLSLVPFHLWTPDVYQGSPAPVTTFLATVSKVAIFAALMRLFLAAPMLEGENLRVVLAFFAFGSILLGNILAIGQTNIKRLLGYSSIAHFGYVLVILIALPMDTNAPTAVAIYLTGYLFSTLAGFGVISLMSSPYRGSDAEALFSYRGLFWHHPILAAVLTIVLLSLAGIPLTLGFIGKFYVLAITINSHLWWLTSAVIIGSAIGLFYYLRTMVSLYLAAPKALRRTAPTHWAKTIGGGVVLLSATIVLILGIYPQILIDLAIYARMN